MDPQETKKRIQQAHLLLTQETTSRQKLESVRILINGLYPKLDSTLESVSSALSEVEKIQHGDIIQLSAEFLPENTEEEKSRKRAVLFFIQTWKQLRSEVERIKIELETLQSSEHSTTQKIQSAGRIVTAAKGALGFVTVIALMIVGAQLFLNKQQLKPTSVTQQVVHKEVIGESSISDDAVLSYWVKEGKVEQGTSHNEIIWAVHVHKETAEIRAHGEHIPATGATITVELQSQKGTTQLSSTAGNDGWAKLVSPLPRVRTELIVTEVKGDLPWAKTDQQNWKNQPLASYTPNQ